MDHTKYIESVKRTAIEQNKKRYFLNHILPVIYESKRLIKNHNVNEDVCILAATFHDIGRIMHVDDHEKYGADFCENILRQDKIDETIISEIKKAILTHQSKETTDHLPSLILRTADGIAQIKHPFFAWGEQEYLSVMGFDKLLEFNKHKLETAYNKIHFDKDKKDIEKLYLARKQLFNKAKNNKANFCLFTVPVMYKKAVWEITQKCNLRCVHCCNGNQINEITHTFSEYKKAINDLKNNCVDEIYFTGGEPFHNIEFLNVLDYAKQEGMICSVATNATLIDDEAADKINKLYLNMLQVSLDGHDSSTHDLIRGKHNFTKAINGIKKINTDNVGKLRISTVLFNHTQDHIEDMVLLAIECKADELIINWPRKVGFFQDNETNLPSITEKDFRKKFNELKEKYINSIVLSTHITNTTPLEGECGGGGNLIFISSNGKISPCSWMCKIAPEYTSKLNIFDNTLNECLNELKIFSDFIHQRTIENKKGCPFIAFKKTGDLSSDDVREM